MQEAPGKLADRIRARAGHAGAPCSTQLAAELSEYLSLLARWNRRINLTSLPLDPATDAAIDRLVIESLLAAPAVRPGDRVAVDIGSGGGSPAIPLRLAIPTLAFTLIEARERKSAFLQEAIRALGLANCHVHTTTAAEFGLKTKSLRFADLLTFRGVRTDRGHWQVVENLLKTDGRAFWFADLVEAPKQVIPSGRLKVLCESPAGSALPFVVVGRG